MKDSEKEKKLAALEAVKYVDFDMIVGLGTGSTAFYAITEIGKLVKNGLKIKAVATSNESAALAKSLNIDLIDINDVNAIDITIDGADEFTSDFLMIKGGGGALFREKVVAAMTKKQIIIADSSKKVDTLGKFKVPVEVVPFAHQYVLRQLAAIDGKGAIRIKNGTEFLTDQGNFIVDADFGLIGDPKSLAAKLNEIEGITAHGLFIGLTNTIIMGENNRTVIFTR